MRKPCTVLKIPVEHRKIRTFHAPDGRRFHRSDDNPEFTVDRVIEVPMPLIRFGRDDAYAVKEILL